MLTLAAGLAPNQITVLLLDLAIMLGLARLLGETARYFRQPAVLGEILAGVLLGPTLFGMVSPEWMFQWLFPDSGESTYALDGFVLLSATLLLFVVGLEVDLSTVWRQGKAALSVSAMGIVIPCLCGFTVATLMPNVLGAGPRGLIAPTPFAIFCGIAMSITALPVIAKILMDLNLAKSDMGMLIISSAMLNDLVGWIGFAVVLALLPASVEVGAAAAGAVSGTDPGGQPQVLTTILLTLGFLVFMMTLGRWAMHRTLPFVQAHWSWPGGVLAYVFVIALLCAAFTEYLGIHSIFGAFIAGVAIGDSHHLRERTRETIQQFITNIFAPIFFASIGLHINFIEAFNPLTVAIVFGVALLGKVGGCYAGARFVKMSKRESMAISFGMAAQGAVGIILGELARAAGLISDELMVAIVIMALGTSLLSGPVMQAILRIQHKRTLGDFLSDRNILLEPRGHDVTQLLGEMSKRAADITGLEPNYIYEHVLQRERIMSTGLAHGLAVPHARLDTLSKPCVIVARHREGIDFDAPDGEPATIIALLLTPTDQPAAQLELLDVFARTFAKGIVRRRILRVASATEFFAVLNQAASEDQLVPHDEETLGIP